MTKTVLLKSIAQYLPDSNSLEDRLTDFVKKSLADSYSQDLDTTLKQLDRAWEAQKLLWQLRDGIEV